MATHHLQLSDVIQAFDELGGEADWTDVEARVMAKRGSGFAPYKDRRNYKNTMFQFVQQHCKGYRKFNGDIRFVKVRDTRFRLASPPRWPPQTPPPVAGSNSSTPVGGTGGTLVGYEGLGKHGARVFHGAARVAPATHTSARRGGKLGAHARCLHFRCSDHACLATRAAASLRRQLLPSNLSRWP